MPIKRRHNQQAKWLLRAMEMTFQGEGLWAHSLLEAVEGLTAEQAAWKPRKKGARSIWEIVHHVAYWKDFLVQRLDGKTTPASDQESWVVEESGEKAWAQEVVRLKNRQNALLKSLRAGKLDFDKRLAGAKSPVGEMLFGVLAHDCYHTGQILTLRQLQGIAS